MTTIHFVYPHGPGISAPDAIGRKVSEKLSRDYRVIPYHWHESRLIKPGKDDVLLGHPHPWPRTTFRLSARQAGWKRIIAMFPYNHDLKQVAFFDFVVNRCDLFLAITGRYWFNSIERSPFAHWRPKMVHLDMAVDRRDFPIVKNEFNEPGRRRLIYIGHDLWFKNTRYLSRIAGAMAETTISWLGGGARSSIPGLNPLGYLDFSHETAKRIIAEHDFMITVGKADCNPTTILEAMAWGLIPVCTPQSGYIGYPGITNVPLDDVTGAVRVLRDLQEWPDERLKEMQMVNWEALDRHFNWDRFAGQIREAIESKDSPRLAGASLGRRLRFLGAWLTSPHVYGHLRFLWKRMMKSMS